MSKPDPIEALEKLYRQALGDERTDSAHGARMKARYDIVADTLDERDRMRRAMTRCIAWRGPKSEMEEMIARVLRGAKL